jgi:nicotinamide phosphoribosyltransferase
VTGVNWYEPYQKWRVRIVVNKKDINLGYFDDFNEAVLAREKAEEKYFKKYSYNNSMKEINGTMDNIMALILADGYKHVHAEQFPKGLTKLVSYMTPRMSRLKSQDYMILFGLQAFIKTYLVKYFREHFFALDEESVVNEYKRILNTMLGEGNFDTEKVRKLHRLGYLPLEISALPEGTKVNMHVPCISITNTHDDFAWVVQWIESLLSSEIWKPCVHANVGYSYRQIVNKYYNLTVDDIIPRSKAISDFGFRGMSCLQEAIKASSSWLTSFSGTATIPAIPYLEQNYNCDNAKEHFATNAISTEHAVMASNFAVDGDEITMIKRLLTEIYPDASFSMVSDTYDLFNLIDNLLPQCREEIMKHNGKILIRPDSGDIVEVAVATVEHLYALFPGETNSKGYKTLDPHVGVVYGDGVTQNRAEKIYQILMERGFASNCIVFGAGSFSFNCIEEDGKLMPITRDTFSVAIKGTYGVVNGREIFIFKDPKTDRSNGKGFKRSQKGLCYVYEEDGELKYKDEFVAATIPKNNLLQPVFKDGVLVREQSLQDVRNVLWKGEF